MTDQESELRRTLLNRYHELQGAIASPDLYEQISAHWAYYDLNYGRELEGLRKDASVMELGTGHGGLLAWFRARGHSNVAGVDASPGEVAFANARLGDDLVVAGDAEHVLASRPGSYDVVIAKAMLEHVPRGRLLPLLRAVHTALLPNGVLLVDVPNMDWIAANHERYMDLTHESGFTRESLEALLRLIFDDVSVRGSTLASPTRSQRLLRPLAIRMLRRLYYLIGEGASDVLFDSRSLIAVAHRRARGS